MLIEAQRADIEEADHEEDHEGDADPGAEVDGEADRRGEIEPETDLEERVHGEVRAIALLLPDRLLLIADDAMLRRPDELDIVAEESLEDGAAIVDGEADAERHHHGEAFHRRP